MSRIVGALLCAAVAILFVRPAFCADDGSRAVIAPANGILDRVSFDQKLGERVPADIELRDEAGRPVRLGALMSDKPVILALVYYECPMLCNEVLNSLLRAFNGLDWQAGKQFDVLTVSFNPNESASLAAAKKARYLKRYRKAGSEAGWRFLTGDEAQVRRLANSVGFRYYYDAKARQYQHAAGIVILSPDGRVSRYLFGLTYPVRDIRLALTEASSGKVGSPIDKVLLFCYSYDPANGKYNFAIMSVLRLLGVCTAVGLVVYMIRNVRGDRRAERAAAATRVTL